MRTLNSKSLPMKVMGLCMALALLGSSCGGGNSSSDSSSNPPTPATATIVAVLAAPGQPVSVVVDGQVLAQNLSYMTATSPLVVTSGQHQLLLQNSGGNACGAQSLDLQPASRTTILCVFPAIFGAIATIDTDDTMPALNSMAKLRISDHRDFNGSDIYVMPFGSTPSGTPFLSDSGSQGPVYKTLAPGNYDIFVVTPPGNSSPPPGTVLYQTGSFPLAASQNRTLYLLTTCQDPTGGGCVENGFTSVTVADLN